ncbi:hypothetical protein Y1Q_0022270 [Alligator mississippiensis]|uniref:Uncharacterized protein n=1 Tax=Alligator mississippiensis TaxID=8496 RepID=A0A151P035_ALLMI|nr:hypothetical protein Y1Q_0022270 [Alligator mississippiensis]
MRRQDQEGLSPCEKTACLTAGIPKVHHCSSPRPHCLGSMASINVEYQWCLSLHDGRKSQWEKKKQATWDRCELAEPCDSDKGPLPMMSESCGN